MSNQIQETMLQWRSEMQITKEIMKDEDTLALFAVTASNRIAFLTRFVEIIEEQLPEEGRKHLQDALDSFEGDMKEASIDSAGTLAVCIRALLGNGGGL